MRPHFQLAAPIAVGSTIWATTNSVYGGFIYKPEDYGGYFKWAAARGIATTYNTTLWSTAGSFPYQSTTTSGGKTTPTGTGSDGSVCPAGWRLPTRMEIAALIGYNGVETENAGDVRGTEGTYTGPGGETIVSAKGEGGWNFTVNDKTLFFPYAGYNGGTDSGSYGNYLSSTEYSASSAYLLCVNSERTCGYLGWLKKSYANSVRCVHPK